MHKKICGLVLRGRVKERREVEGSWVALRVDAFLWAAKLQAKSKINKWRNEFNRERERRRRERRQGKNCWESCLRVSKASALGPWLVLFSPSPSALCTYLLFSCLLSPFPSSIPSTLFPLHSPCFCSSLFSSTIHRVRLSTSWISFG